MCAVIVMKTFLLLDFVMYSKYMYMGMQKQKVKDLIFIADI